MWQLAAVLALFTHAGERIGDKAAMVYDAHVDTYVATFYRQFVFLFFTVAVGYLGFAGKLTLIFNWRVLVVALVSVPSVLFYTQMLRKLEVTLLEAIACLSPIIFLAIDTVLLHVGLTVTQVVAIIILSTGGFAFALDGRTHKVRKELTPFAAFVLAYFVFQTGVEFYMYKSLHSLYGTDGVSFYASVWLLVMLAILAVVIGKGKAHRLLAPTSLRYLPFAAVAKSFDASTGLLLLYALTFASVSQVAAIGALEPFVVFVAAVLTQKRMRIKIREHIDTSSLHWKAGAVCLLVVGGFLIR